MYIIMMLQGGENAVKRVPFSKEAIGVFFQALDLMWKSMLGIFGVILVFYIVILILGRVGKSNE